MHIELCNPMKYTSHLLWNVKCAMQNAEQWSEIQCTKSGDHCHNVPSVKIELLVITIWYSKHLTSGFRNFSLALNISESYFEPWNFIGMKTGGRGWIFLVSLKPPPKSNLEPCTVWGGRENSHISYIGDNFSRSQIAPLSSFHIYWLNNLTCLEHFSQYLDIKIKERANRLFHVQKGPSCQN